MSDSKATLSKDHPAYKAVMLVYVMMLGSVLLQAALLAALLGVLGARDGAKGTPFEGHMTWQLITLIVTFVLGGAVFAVYSLYGLKMAAMAGGPVVVWYLYRVIRGGLAFMNGQVLANPKGL